MENKYTFRQKVVYTMLSGISLICYFVGWINVLDEASGVLSMFVDMDSSSLSLLKLFSIGLDVIDMGYSFGSDELSGYTLLFVISVAVIFLLGVITFINLVYRIWRYETIRIFSRSLGFTLGSTVIFVLAVVIINSSISESTGDFSDIYSDYISITAAPIINIIVLLTLLIIMKKGYKFEYIDSESEKTTNQNIIHEPQKIAVITCSKCGKENDSNNKFCYSCGNNLEEKKKYCSKCGTEVNDDAIYCLQCGYKVK